MFKSTGIIRKIDNQGRVSIPRELRKKLRFDDDAPIELGESEESIVLRKYSAVGEFVESSRSIIESFSSVTNLPVILCGTDAVVISKKTPDMSGRIISDELYECIKKKSIRIPSVPILRDDLLCSAEVELIYSLSNVAIGALVIPESDIEVTQSQKDCLRLCAKAIGQLVG